MEINRGGSAAHEQRSRHLPPIRRPQAASRRLGRRASRHRRAARSPTAASSPAAASQSAARASAPTTSCATPATSPSPWSRPRPSTRPLATGLQQAKDYAEILGLKFAYATNGHGIIEFDYLTGLERELDDLPHARRAVGDGCRPREQLSEDAADAPADARLNVSRRQAAPLLPGDRHQPRHRGRSCKGKRRILLTMATGTGKTFVAFQICWKLWTARWNRTGEHRKPRILYLADRNILVDDPKDKTFAPFGDARWKIENGDGRSRAARCTSPSTRPSPRTSAGPASTGSTPRLLRPRHRRRVPPRQRPRREQLARDPRILRARLPARHDRHAAARGQRATPTATSATRSTPTACARASTTASSPPTACTA